MPAGSKINKPVALDMNSNHHNEYSTSGSNINRRSALKGLASAAATLALSPHGLASAQESSAAALVVKPAPTFELSPFLFMQFMEPLGTTDGSVEASWDHLTDRWRPDLVEVTRDLAPGMLRWGGLFSRYYRWREGVGPRDKRTPMHNLVWGGIESNQVGTAEFVEFCRRTGAEPLMCVNFESDGFERFKTDRGSVRTADAREAADWVAYCNQSGHTARRADGYAAPLTIKYWQLGNETSYGKEGVDVETAARKTVAFARAMRESDPSIQLIGWGDSGWAGRMAEIAGEHLQFLAFHHMFDPDNRKQPVLAGARYRRDPDATWATLMDAWKIHEEKIRRTRDSLGRHRLPLALTECHFSVPGPNRNDVLRTWAAGVSYARILNTHQRHGDVLKIATAADFCGTRWTVNAVMLPVPGQRNAYLMPVARIMRLYRRHIGTHALAVVRLPDGLDVVASRKENKVFLHVANTLRTRAVKARLQVEGQPVRGGRVFQIAEDPMAEVSELNAGEVMQTVERPLPADGAWEFPAASVSAVELEVA